MSELLRDEVVEAERHLVGAVLLRPDCFDLVSLDSRQFGHPLAALAWEVFAELRADGRPIDIILAAEAVPSRKTAAREQIVPFLTGCLVSVATADNAEFYADIVRQAHVTRSACLALSGVLERAKRGDVAGDELVGEALAALSRIDTEQPDSAVPIGHAARARFEELSDLVRRRAEGDAAITGAPTGVEKLDSLLGGFRYGLASIVCGRPGMGKSSFALGVADACSTARLGVHEFSLEDTRDTRIDRAVSRLSGVSSQAMQRVELTANDLRDIRDAYGALWKRQGWLVDDRSGISAEELVRSVRRRQRENNTRVVIVDYVQLLARPRHAKSVHEHHAHSIHVLANAAKADGMAYVVLSQLSREVERRTDKRPMLSDLRESGALEERAKQVVGLYRGAYYGDPREGIDYGDGDPRPRADEWQQRVELIVLKNANGETGVIRARWDGPTTRVS